MFNLRIQFLSRDGQLSSCHAGVKFGLLFCIVSLQFEFPVVLTELFSQPLFSLP